MDTICEKKKLQILPVQMIKPVRLKEKESCPNKIENHFCIFLLIPIPEKKKEKKKKKKKRNWMYISAKLVSRASLGLRDGNKLRKVLETRLF